MVRKLRVLVVCGVVALVAGTAHAATGSVHLAQIRITKVTVEDGGTVTVRVAITGFRTPGHWDLSYRRLGQRPELTGKVHVRRGTLGSPATNFLPGERWLLTARLVDSKDRPFSAAKYPNAKLTDSRVVRAR
jgi:hypothetical protein